MKNIMPVTSFAVAVLSASLSLSAADGLSAIRARTQRLHDSKWGVFNHYLSHDGRTMHVNTGEEWNARVNAFDVKKLADQLESCGAKFYFITVMQGRQFMCAPNATFDRIAGTKPGEACSLRDLPADIAAELNKRGIDLYLYFTGDGPQLNAEIGGKFGYVRSKSAGVTRSFVEKWSSVLEEYAVRYGKNVKGWWIDGCSSRRLNYTDELLSFYAAAVKKGNPDAIVSMNKGLRPYFVKNYSKEDFTAGEFNDFYVIPRQRFIDGAQAFLLAPLGVAPDGHELNSWAKTGCKHDGEFMGRFVDLVNRNGGVVAIDVKVFPDASFDPEQLEVLKEIGRITGTLKK